MSKKYIIVIGVIISLAGCSQSTVKLESEDIIPPFPKEEAQRPDSPLEPKNPFPKPLINILPNCISFRNAVNRTTLTVETGERLTELSRCQRERNTCSGGKCILTRRCSQVLACLGQ